MKIIKDQFKAMDAMEYAASESCTFTITANTITAKEKLMPKMALFQIRTKGFTEDVMAKIKSYLPKAP